MRANAPASAYVFVGSVNAGSTQKRPSFPGCCSIGGPARMRQTVCGSVEPKHRSGAAPDVMPRCCYSRSAVWRVILVVLGHAACLHVAHASRYPMPRVLASTVPQQICNESVMIMPVVPGEVVQNKMTTPRSYVNGSGVCVMVTGAVTLVSLAPGNLTVYQASGATAIWWAGANPLYCKGSFNVATLPLALAAVRQYYANQGFLVAAVTGTDFGCCTEESPCSGTDFDVLHSPALTVATPASDWATVQGYAFNSSYKPVPLNPSLYNDSQASQPYASDCADACASIPGCASFFFSPATSMCTFYASEPGRAFPLAPCNRSNCQFGFRMPGLCGLTASQGISHVGQRWPGWQPGLLQPASSNASDTRYASWGADAIPPGVQGRQAITASECSCRCASVGNCVGYTWSPNNQTCWLLNNIQPWQTTENDPDPNTILGRVVTGDVIPRCNSSFNWANASAATGNSKRITTFPQDSFPINATSEMCYNYCTQDPACQASVTRGNLTDTYVDCWLLSEVHGGLSQNQGMTLSQIQRCQAEPPVPRIRDDNLDISPGWLIQTDLSTLGNTTYLGLLTNSTTRPNSSSLPQNPSSQGCFELCHSLVGCGVAIYNSNTTTCFPAFLVSANNSAVNAIAPAAALQQQQCGPDSNCIVASRKPGSCGLIASSGVLQLGQHWAGWTQGQTQGTWGQAGAIEPQYQNTTVQSASDCACQCQKSAVCIAYIFLGDVQRCWLQNHIEFSNGFEPDKSPLTVAGQLTVPNGMVPNCTKQNFAAPSAAPSSVPYTLDPTRVQRRPNPFPAKTTDQCNEACLLDPFCLAYALLNASSRQPSCQLYSTASKGGVTAFPDGQFSLVQRCPFVSAYATSTDSHTSTTRTNTTVPNPPPVAPVDASAPYLDEHNASGSSPVVGIAIGASIGGAAVLLIAVIGGLVWHRRKKRQATEAVYKADDPSGAPDASSETLDKQAAAGGMVLADENARNESDGSEGGPGRISALWSATLTARQAPSQAGHVGSKDLAAMTGLLAGDPFLMSVSSSYRWSTDAITDMVAVEEGINAGALAAKQRKAREGRTPRTSGTNHSYTSAASEAEADMAGAGPDPVQLTTAEVQQQVELMANGMVDRGATAVVFKCRWASRFGPNALLAIKCMRDPYAYNMSQMLESFKYEVDVLSKCRHPNVVRIYGYCLEPPVVCVILELLPGSLKDRLYGSNLAHIKPMILRSTGNVLAAGAIKRLLLASDGALAGPVVPPSAKPSGALQLKEKEKIAIGAATPAGSACLDRPGSGLRSNTTSAGSLLPPLPPIKSTGRRSNPGRRIAASTLPGAAVAAYLPAAAATGPMFITNMSYAPSDDPASRAASLAEQQSGTADVLSPATSAPQALSPATSVPQGLPAQVLGNSITSSMGSALSLQHSMSGGSPKTMALPLPGKRPVITRISSVRRASTGGCAPEAPEAPEVFSITALEVLQLGTDVAAGLAHLHSKPEARRLGLPDLTGRTSSDGRSSVASSMQQRAGPPSTQGDNDDTFVNGQTATRTGELGRVVHRDLKPANILINSLGHAKISDFGLAREHQNTTVYTQHYGAGTLSYMAPELLKGASTSKLTDKVDIYSLGIMLWELATRQLPWKNCSDVQVQALVTSGQRPPVPGEAAGPTPSRQRPASESGGPTGGACNDEMLKQLPGYTSLVRACWQDKPHRRPAARAVHKALQKLVDTAVADEATEAVAAAELAAAQWAAAAAQPAEQVALAAAQWAAAAAAQPAEQVAAVSAVEPEQLQGQASEVETSPLSEAAPSFSFFKKD